MNIGILIPYRYYVETDDPRYAIDTREGDIGENLRFAKKFDYVYWDLNVLTRLYDEEFRKEMGVTLPTCCFFYNANPDSATYQRVTHRAIISEAYSLEVIRNDSSEWKYIPEWRYQCIKGKWSDENSWVVKEHPEWIGKGHKPSKLWIKLRGFKELNPPRRISDFRKWNGSKLKGRRGAYIQCPDF